MLEFPKVRRKHPTELQSVTYGNTIILEAEFFATPPLTKIRWEKNTNVIYPDSKKFSEDSSKAGIVKLIISNTDFDDSGRYWIKVTNARGSAKEHRDVNVKIKVKKILLYIKVYIYPFDYSLILYNVYK